MLCRGSNAPGSYTEPVPALQWELEEGEKCSWDHRHRWQGRNVLSQRLPWSQGHPPPLPLSLPTEKGRDWSLKCKDVLRGQSSPGVPPHPQKQAGREQAVTERRAAPTSLQLPSP